MQTLLQARFVSVDECEGALVVGFAHREGDPSAYFMLQRSQEPDDDGRVYLEHTDQAHGTYGQVASCVLSRSRIELAVGAATARALGTEIAFAVEFLCDDTALARLWSGLERIFAGTGCRLQMGGGL